ncbi:MAG: hypothetical protein AAFX00_09650 [Pseudomonadota bacterium]
MRALWVVALLAGGPAWGQGTEARAPDASGVVAEIFAEQIDTDSDGKLSRMELLVFGVQVFASMDTDSDGDVSKAEWRDWEFGARDIAVFREKADSYDTAFGIVFDIFDRSQDGFISSDEFERAVLISTENADLDGDSALSVQEYVSNFIISIAIRNVYER